MVANNLLATTLQNVVHDLGGPVPHLGGDVGIGISIGEYPNLCEMVVKGGLMLNSEGVALIHDPAHSCL